MTEYTMLPEFPVESPEWFAARAAGVSASDMQLLGRGTPAAFAAVKARKTQGDPFTGNAFTRWGNEREPFIAAHVEFLFGVEPTNRICVSTQDARWIASPDGISGDYLGEYKTTGTDWDDIPAHYYDQVQWAQFVTGIHRTVFAWEVRLGAAPEFAPGPIRHRIIDHDPERVAELVEVAESFWEFLQTDQDSSEWDGLLAEYAIAEAAAKEAAAELDAVKARIRERAGDNDLAVKSPLGSISLALQKPRESFDSVAFKKANPDLYREFVRVSPPKDKTLRVTVK